MKAESSNFKTILFFSSKNYNSFNVQRPNINESHCVYLSIDRLDNLDTLDIREIRRNSKVEAFRRRFKRSLFQTLDLSSPVDNDGLEKKEKLLKKPEIERERENEATKIEK